jgi:hypothetical protein
MISKDSATPDEAQHEEDADLVIRPAIDRAELESAYELVYQNYHPRHYIPPHPSCLRLTIFNAFPSTITFVGVVRGEVIATVSLIADTPIGLPMDEIYHDEVQALRDAGRRLVEVTMLADRRLSDQRSLAMVLALMKLVFDCATLSLKATDLCITVNPHHNKFYDEYLLFSPLGGLRAYPSVSGNPAIARRHDLERVEEEFRRRRSALLRHFFENRTPLSLFEQRYHMTAADLRFFFMERTQIFQNSPACMLNRLRDHYPDFNWDELLADRLSGAQKGQGVSY